MAATGDSGKGNAGAPRKNDAPERRRLLRHLLAAQGGQAGAQQPALQRAPDQAPLRPLAPVAVRNAQAMALRTAQQKQELMQKLSQAKSTLDQAAKLAQEQAIPQPLRDDFTQTRMRFLAAAQGTQAGGFATANARLGEHKRAAVNLINGSKAAGLKRAQLADQGSQFDDVSDTLNRVKKSSFPVGQAAYIESLPALAKKSGRDKAVAFDPQFKTYLTTLADLESYKAAAQTNGGEATYSAQLQAKCAELIAAADGYLAHYAADLTEAQQQDSTRLSEKRYCEEGRLSARQYMLALEFEAVPDPRKSPQGWSEEQQIRAASVRAKILYHEAYQQATTLGDSGDAAGASESRWLKGADWQGVQQAPTGSLRSDDAGGLSMPVQARTAIFKAAAGEKAPDGMSDKKGAGAIKEALACANAKLFAQQTGIDLGVPETNVVAVPRYALKGGGPDASAGGNKGAPKEDELVIGSAQQNAGAKQDLSGLSLQDREAIDVKDVHRIALIDLMSLNCDRHAGNLMVKPVQRGNRNQPSLVPIDHGGSLPTRADFTKAKARIAGVDAGGAIVNALLMMPGAYEPFDPATLAQLDLLDPQAIEDGMKRQRQAMDAVHPGLRAKEKLPDTSLHLAKRSMMFTKRAAKVMSPAEIQIVLGQRGEELFDVDDAGFNDLADRLIADFAPLKEAYKEVLTGSADFRAELVQWLTDNGWVQFDPVRVFEASGANFLMKNPELALKLFRSGTANPNPPPTPIEASDKVAAPNAKKPATVDDELKERYAVAFPTSSGEATDKQWIDRAHYLDLFLKLGGPAVYQDVLRRTGAETDSNPKAHVQALQYWAQLRQPANLALLQALEPKGAGVAASDFLKDYLEVGLNVGPFAAVMTAADQAAAAVVVAPDQVLAADLLRIRAIAADPFAGAQAQALNARADDIEARAQRRELAPDAAHQEALNLEGQARRIVLDAIAAAAQAAADDLKTQVLDRSRHVVIDKNCSDILGACLAIQSIDAAHRALDLFDRQKATFLKDEAADKAERALLPPFQWDADTASAVKKSAVRQGFIRDKDTGMSAALKAVGEAQKGLDAVLGGNVRSEKKRPQAEKAIAAYRKFIVFVEGSLRPLAAQNPAHKAWTAYCDGAVKAANDKIAFIGTLMSNWG